MNTRLFSRNRKTASLAIVALYIRGVFGAVAGAGPPAHRSACSGNGVGGGTCAPQPATPGGLGGKRSIVTSSRSANLDDAEHRS